MTPSASTATVDPSAPTVGVLASSLNPPARTVAQPPRAAELADPLTSRPGARRDGSELLRAFLNILWLRPENALWMTLRSLALRAEPFTAPSADICCGDGLFTFVHAGGRPHAMFDAFGGLSTSPPHSTAGSDFFDQCPADYAVPIAQTPEFHLTHGLDHKPNLLRKAAALGFYENLRKHDCSRPLPFEPASLKTLYCNSAYWMRDVEGLLRSFRQALASDGRLILHVKLDIPGAWGIDGLHHAASRSLARLLEGDRRPCWPGLLSRRGWEAHFGKAGFKIVSCRSIASRAHAALWNVGLRPIAPLLARLSAAAAPYALAAVKADWVALFHDICRPLLNPDLVLFPGGEEPVELQYVLTSSA